MTMVNYPGWLHTQTYSAASMRRHFDKRSPVGEGVVGRDDFRVSQRGAGANMSVDIAAGDAFVRGDDVANQGLYHVVNDAVANLAIATAHATLPRIDQIVARVYDSTVTGSSDVPTLESIAGTATSGATLDNRTGVAALPNGAVLLADVVVGAAVSSIVDANIRSRRPFVTPIVPPLVGPTGAADIDQVPLIPVPGVGICNYTNPNQWASSWDLAQGAIAVYLPRRIVAATKMRWAYAHGGTALTGNYVLGLFDASGRKIVDTGSVALTGAGNSFQPRAETISATTLEAGLYYLFLGLDTTNAGTVNPFTASAGFAEGPNQMLRAATGGVTVPTTLLGLADSTAGSTQTVPIPICSLSVG